VFDTQKYNNKYTFKCLKPNGVYLHEAKVDIEQDNTDIYTISRDGKYFAVIKTDDQSNVTLYIMMIAKNDGK
jgi:hypothetical protein